MTNPHGFLDQSPPILNHLLHFFGPKKGGGFRFRPRRRRPPETASTRRCISSSTSALRGSRAAASAKRARVPPSQLSTRLLSVFSLGVGVGWVEGGRAAVSGLSLKGYGWKDWEKKASYLEF